MVKDEVCRFLQTQSCFSPSQCASLVNELPASEKTVAAFAWCGETVGVSFLSKNFKKILGYSPETFIDEGVDFVISRVHPNDRTSFFEFMEALHQPQASWFENAEKGCFEHTFRLRHCNGDWVWVQEKLLVLSITPEGWLDKVFITFTDITDWKNKQEEEKTKSFTAHSKKSKLMEALIKYKKMEEEKVLSSPLNDHALTERERQVLELVSKGYSSKQIAHYLFISKHTVESHRKHLLRKLKVNNAAELVQRASLSSLN